MDNNIKNFPRRNKKEQFVLGETDIFVMPYENQLKALEIRSKEIDYEKQEEEHNFQFSKSILEMQLEDRKAIYSHYSVLQRNTYLLILFLFTGMTTLIVFSMVLNKEAIALELIKMAAYGLAGGLGGYGVGKSKQKEEISQKDGEHDV